MHELVRQKNANENFLLDVFFESQFLPTVAATGHTLRAYGAAWYRRVRPILLPLLGDANPRTIGPSEVNYILSQLRTHYSASTVNATASAMSSLWRAMIGAGIVSMNPWVVVRREPSRGRVRSRRLTRDEVSRIINAMPDLRTRVLARFLYLSGARIAEVIGDPKVEERGLRWRDVQKVGDTVQVHLFGKRGKEGTVNLPGSVWDLLMSMAARTRRPDDFVFRQTNGEPYRYQRIRRIFLRAQHRAGVDKNVTPHWFRHANATHALEAGADLLTVKQTLRHSRLDTTEIYLDLVPKKSTAHYLIDNGGESADGRRKSR